MMHKPPTRRDAADAVRLKAEGDPAHINAREAAALKTLMPEAAGPVITKGLLAQAGRRGDDRVTKLIPAEQALLKARGGSGTRNPATGLLEFGDGMGGSDNPGGGHNADGAASSGGYGGGGVSSSPGDSSSYGTGTSYGPARDVGYAWGNQPNGYRSPDDPYGAVTGRGLDQRAYDPATMPSIESLLDTPNGFRAPGFEGIGMHQYSPPDTFGRLLDTYRYGPPPSYTARGKAPGNFGAPTGLGPGIAGKVAANFGGPMMSGLMNVGMHMDQAMSPETRAASLAANQAQGAKNSTGNDRALSQVDPAGVPAAMPGADPNATALPPPPPGFTRNPAGQIVPMPNMQQGRGKPIWQDPARNLIADYIFRGPNGRGWA